MTTSSQSQALTLTRDELEQALQDSEMQELLFAADVDLDDVFHCIGEDNEEYSRKLSDIFTPEKLRKAIIDRLFMWQAVNRSIKS